MADLINLKATTPDGEADSDVGRPMPKSYSIQRLQIGFAGLAAMVLMVGLASVVMDRVDEAEAAIETNAGEDLPAEVSIPVQNDPLADAGLVPDLPAEPEPEVEAPAQGMAAAPADEAAQD